MTTVAQFKVLLADLKDDDEVLIICRPGGTTFNTVPNGTAEKIYNLGAAIIAWRSKSSMLIVKDIAEAARCVSELNKTVLVFNPERFA